MRQCTCGCQDFTVPMIREIHVKGTVHFNLLSESEITAVYNTNTPDSFKYVGPFVCQKCGAVYETEFDIPGYDNAKLGLQNITELSCEQFHDLYTAWEDTYNAMGENYDGPVSGVETGLFFSKSKNTKDGRAVYTGIDNSRGEMILEDFSTREGCIAWLNGADPDEIWKLEQKGVS